MFMRHLVAIIAAGKPLPQEGKQLSVNCRKGEFTMKRTSVAAWVGLVTLAILEFSGPAYAQCPPQNRVEQLIAKFEAPDKRLITLRPTDYSGLCEAHVQLNGKTHIFYTGSAGDYFLMGQLYDSASGRNVTRDTLEAITFFSPEEMERMAGLRAFTIGQQGKVLFYVTDPQCPYCKKGAETLEKMASAGEIQVHFLLFPLDSHKGAREQSVSTICDNKSLHEFESGYRSDNLCEDGTRKIDATREVLSQKGVSGTPTYIFPDRRFHAGLLEEAELRRRLGLTAKGIVEKPSAKKSP
jgi:thiol:disulfide interchange protein DsbC